MFNIVESLSEKLSILNYNTRELLLKLYTWSVSDEDFIAVRIRTEDKPYVIEYTIPTKKYIQNNSSISRSKSTSEIIEVNSNITNILKNTSNIVYLNDMFNSAKNIFVYKRTKNDIITLVFDLKSAYGFTVYSEAKVVLANIAPRSTNANKAKLTLQYVEDGLGNLKYEVLDYIRF